MSKYICKYIKKGIGDPSSKYAYDRDGKQFEKDIQKRIEDSEQLYEDFKKWMAEKSVTPQMFRALFRKYYDEFIAE